MRGFDVQAVREQFPILTETVHGKPLVYLDNAATSQKPRCVLDAMQHYYQHHNANVHRGVHDLSVRATDAFEAARETLREFINAKSSQEIIFVRNGTEAINLIAHSFGLLNIGPGDEVLVTQMEHHANIVSWQLHCQRVGARLKVLPINQAGECDLAAVPALLTDKVKIFAVTHISNVLGTINPVKAMIELAHQQHIPVLVDGAQAGPHLKIDVQDLDCDFYTLSGHKMYGPTGIGVLYGKQAWLEQLPPYQGGGDMILQVSFEQSTFAPLPNKFEAGTPNIAGAIGLAAAAKFIQQVGHDAIQQHEMQLLSYAMDKFSQLDNITIYGTATEKAAVIAFNDDDIHPHDMGTIMDTQGVAVRTGHHCAMPLMEYYQVPAMVRASFAMFNTTAEIDQMLLAMQAVREVMV